MNLFTLSSLLVFTLNTLTALFVFWKGQGRLRILWFCFCLATAIWGLGGYGLSLAKIELSAYFWWQIAYIGIITSFPLFYHSVFIFLNLNKRIDKLVLIYAYITGAIFLFYDLFFPRVFLGALRLIFDQFYWLDPLKEMQLSFLLFYVSSLWFLLIYSFFRLVKFYKNSTGMRRNQFKYFTISLLIGWFGAELCFLPTFRIDVYPNSNFLVALYPTVLAYAIFKYRLMDIKVAITRAGVFAFVYLFVLGIPFLIGYKYHLWGYAIAIMAILATIGPFAFISLSRRAEASLLREERRAHELLKQASRRMARIHNKKALFDLTGRIIAEALKLENALIFLVDEKTGNFNLSAASFGSKYNYLEVVDSDDSLIKKLSGMEEPLVYEEVKDEKIESQMRKLKAAVIVPAISNARLVAFLALGEKASKKMYSQEDLSTLWALSCQTALAIDNVFLYEKEKMHLVEQSRREALADMAPGASHQFNNRLAAIGMTADNLLDLIKADAQGYSKEQIIKELFSNIEVIRDEVVKGKQITAAILQKAKVKLEFDKVDIVKIIQNAINLTRLRRTRETLTGAEEPEFGFNYPHGLPLLNLCEGIMQDVFENMFNNAYDAIAARNKRKIEPLPYQGKITINISRNENSVVITVEDNGIGVQKENLQKLFTDLFTTKATAEKGVAGGFGLGLGVMRSFVEEHGGSIAVDSEYLKWTRFTITLPLDFKSPE